MYIGRIILLKYVLVQPSLFEKGDNIRSLDMSGLMDSYKFGYILCLGFASS